MKYSTIYPITAAQLGITEDEINAEILLYNQRNYNIVDFPKI